MFFPNLSDYWNCKCAQLIHRHGGRLAHQVVVVKIASGQALQVHVGLELRVELLMGGVIAIQGDDLSRVELFWQRGLPAFEHILGQQQIHTMFINGALSQAIVTPSRVAGTAHIGQIQALLPDAFALASAQRHPLRGGISRLLAGNGLNRITSGITFDDEGDVAVGRA